MNRFINRVLTYILRNYISEDPFNPSTQKALIGETCDTTGTSVPKSSYPLVIQMHIRHLTSSSHTAADRPHSPNNYVSALPKPHDSVRYGWGGVYILHTMNSRLNGNSVTYLPPVVYLLLIFSIGYASYSRRSNSPKYV
jgi:hypothetical protein